MNKHLEKIVDLQREINKIIWEMLPQYYSHSAEEVSPDEFNKPIKYENNLRDDDE